MSPFYCVREISYAYFDMSELKNIFHSYPQLEINSRSLFMFCLLTTEKNDVSSANRLEVNKRLLSSSFIKIRKRSAPKMDLHGTLAWAGSRHSHVWSFKTTLWNLFFRKLVINLRCIYSITINHYTTSTFVYQTHIPCQTL